MEACRYILLVAVVMTLAACGDANDQGGASVFSEARVHEPKMLHFVPIPGSGKDRLAGEETPQGIGKKEWVKLSKRRGELIRLWGRKGDFYFSTTPDGEGVPYSAELVPKGTGSFYLKLNPKHSKQVVILRHCIYTQRTAAKCGMMEEGEGQRAVPRDL